MIYDPASQDLSKILIQLPVEILRVRDSKNMPVLSCFLALESCIRESSLVVFSCRLDKWQHTASFQFRASGMDSEGCCRVSDRRESIGLSRSCFTQAVGGPFAISRNRDSARSPFPSSFSGIPFLGVQTQPRAPASPSRGACCRSWSSCLLRVVATSCQSIDESNILS